MASSRSGRRRMGGTERIAPQIRWPSSTRGSRAERPVAAPELGAFWGGAVGYFSYDVVRLIESLPNGPANGRDIPDAVFVFTRSVVIIDNLRAQARVVVSAPIDADADDTEIRRAYDEAVRDLDDVVVRLHSTMPLPPLTLQNDAPAAIGTSSASREQFMTSVERVKDYIRAGDCFQALLARRIDVPHDFPSDSLYRALRALNPSPYMYHLVLDGVELVGSSPELLVRVADQRVTVRPIAGTRPRGATAEEDQSDARRAPRRRQGARRTRHARRPRPQ